MAHRLLKSGEADPARAAAHVVGTEAGRRMPGVDAVDAPTTGESYEHYAPVRASLIALS